MLFNITKCSWAIFKSLQCKTEQKTLQSYTIDTLHNRTNDNYLAIDTLHSRSILQSTNLHSHAVELKHEGKDGKESWKRRREGEVGSRRRRRERGRRGGGGGRGGGEGRGGIASITARRAGPRSNNTIHLIFWREQGMLSNSATLLLLLAALSLSSSYYSLSLSSSNFPLSLSLFLSHTTLSLPLTHRSICLPLTYLLTPYNSFK